MQSGKVLLCLVLFAAAACLQSDGATLPLLLSRQNTIHDVEQGPESAVPAELMRAVREGVPPPLCAGRCGAPPAGPVCAFDALGTARTFATLCELEAVSCRESTYYAITSLGEC
ncbi:hypothetical protein JYU34_017181 [Plutella xylostella]|uniref:Uncharacterized protein n=2 Tax=Plutella xylostella TaxID=51655 RepID=A0ABQ7Q0J6_PLUXY|nr:uncharacterized protein LOC105398205 [Plutella xylostella]KAG7298761.1 hypothetical protein JYU34_017181 [Plutella xylostella]CAG9133591.1 unnamed protein product [Plutella xylostella]